MAASQSFLGYFLPQWVFLPQLSKFITTSGAFFLTKQPFHELCDLGYFNQ
jgi:hypothetical protein